MLQNVYTRSADVVPRGLSGYNTRWYLKYAIPTLKKEINHGVYTPVFITVWLGANDAALPNGGSYKQHVPKETYKANLVKIAHAFKEMAPDAEILLITPPHIDDNARLKLAEQNNRSVDRTNAMTGTYAQACAEAAELLDGSDPNIGGWVCKLQYCYTRSADVVVRGLYGYSTEMFVRQALPKLAREVGTWSEPPALVTLWLGGNDSALLSGYEAALHVPLAQYRANLRTIVVELQQKAPEAAILLITPPAVNDQLRLELSGDGELDFSNAGTAAYAQACVEEAHAIGVSVLDLHTTMNALNEQERKDCQNDGLHLTTKGNALVADAILATVEREFPTLARRLNKWEHPDYLALLAKVEK
ncbi:hypothetical protein JM18_006451 [Phytophthora kernoviae]|nr:hypothetical protein G195_007845 [Phytophthora kernoviae 00238/432]KAG2518259.1 hypothetical protein JM18_006451 [Phytophthora kernoviae]